jgi:hypothetical protein
MTTPIECPNCGATIPHEGVRPSLEVVYYRVQLSDIPLGNGWQIVEGRISGKIRYPGLCTILFRKNDDPSTDTFGQIDLIKGVAINSADIASIIYPSELAAAINSMQFARWSIWNYECYDDDGDDLPNPNVVITPVYKENPMVTK